MSVDVVIPVFNGRAWVGRAIASALAQQVDGLAVYCIDDGSADGTWDLLCALAAQEPRLRAIRQENAGVAATRNTAIRMGDGEFIAMLDADDEWLPGSLARRLSEFQGHDEVCYVVGRQNYLLSAAGTEAPAWVRPEHLATPQPASIPSTLVVRRSAWLRIGEFDVQYRNRGEDTDWFARARRSGMAWREVEDAVVNRTLRSGSLSNTPGPQLGLLAIVRSHVNAQREAA